MEEKNEAKIRISTLLLILAIIAIAVMAAVIYKTTIDKAAEVQKAEELQEQVDSLNETISDLRGKMDNISEIIDSTNSENKTNTSNNEAVQNTANSNSSKNSNSTNTTSVEEKSKYTNTLKDAVNGKTAFYELESKGEFETEKHDGYYTYVDLFSQTYNIKEIIDVECSQDGMMSRNNYAALFEVTVKYKDNNDKTQTMVLAVSLNKDYEPGCSGTYDMYTGSTSFVRSF
ncbi:MAG: hypothetical protein K6D97_00030 [Clostridia bacterium]|nr:hypothetical protein [Clostridia bacterium]